MVPALARALEKCRDVPERQAALQAERNRRDLLSQSVAKQIEELISVYGRSEEFARRASSELALKACDACACREYVCVCVPCAYVSG